MEGWQKGAKAVLGLSTAGKERYFKRFPERKAWFEANHPEHFGRSVAVATTSLKKVTKAKVKKQRLAAIRQAVEKRDQLQISSAAVRAMGDRRRESGEGLGGGLETNSELIRAARDGWRISSGGLGSLFEQEKKGVYQENGKWYADGVEYPNKAAAQNAIKNNSSEKPAEKEFIDRFLVRMAPSAGGGQSSGIVNPSQPIYTVDNKGGAIGSAGATNSEIDQLSKQIGSDWLTGFGYKWPNAGEGGRWEASMRQQGRPVYASEVDLNDHLRKASPGAGPQKDEQGNEIPLKRLPFSKTIQVGDVPRKPGENYFTSNKDWSQGNYKNTEENLPRNPFYVSEESPDMSNEENLAKQFAEKVMEEKRLQECMPMAMMIKSKDSESKDNDWDYMDTWEKNPIKKGSTSSESDEESGEYDYEGDMAKSQLRSIMHNSKMLHDMLEDTTNLPEWVQSKLTLAEDYIVTAANYMRGEMDRMNEEVEQINEGPNYLQYRGTIYPNIGDIPEGEENPDHGIEYTLTVPRDSDLHTHLGGDYSVDHPVGQKGYNRVARENPHLEPHHVMAIMNGTGYNMEDVPVTHGDKTYTHRIYNEQEPDYLYEQTENLEEAQKKLKPYRWRAEWRLGTESDVDKNNLKIFKKLAAQDPKKAEEFQKSLMKLKKKDMKEETDEDAIHQSMQRTMEKDLPFEPTGTRKPGDVVDKSGAVHTSMSRVRHLAQMALQAGNPEQKAPLEGEEGHAQIRAEHEAQTGGGQIAEGAGARRKSKSDDLVKRSMLPDRSVIPAGKGFGDDIKRKKIVKKVSKAIAKKRMVLPTDNPSENELIPPSMLPDVPGYPEGYKLEEQVIEQQTEAPVVEENKHQLAVFASNFLTRTSNR